MMLQHMESSEPVTVPTHEQAEHTSEHTSSPKPTIVLDNSPSASLQKKCVADLPTPATIEKQKKAYLAMLDGQLQQGLTVLNNQAQFQKEYLAAQAQNQKTAFTSHTEHELRQQEAALQRQYSAQTYALQEQAGKQRLELEKQALSLTLMYQQKKAEEEMQRQKYELEKLQSDVKIQLEKDMKKLGITSMPLLVLPNEGIDQITMSTSTVRALPDGTNPAPVATGTPVANLGSEAETTKVDDEELRQDAKFLEDGEDKEEDKEDKEEEVELQEEHEAEHNAASPLPPAVEDGPYDEQVKLNE